MYCRTNRRDDGCVFSSGKQTTGSTVAIFKVEEKEGVSRDFLLYCLQHSIDSLAGHSHGSTMKHIKKSALDHHSVFLPPLPEQEKIAEILGSVDAAIEATQGVIDQITRTKKALMTELLQGKKDAAGNITPWEKVRFSEVTRELKKRNTDGALGIEKVMGVNKALGIVPMRRETIGSSLDRYKILPPNAFAYNPMRLNIGSLAMCNKTQPVMVSPDYVVFECRENVLNPSYFNHFRRSHIWDRFMEIAGNGSVRIRIYYKDLASLRLPLPSLEEQGKIVKILDGADTVQATNQARLNQLKKLKTALMQALLTGTVRVPVQTTIQHTNQHKEVVNG
ncbi:MAG: restriction endonuclease subunit S [Alphaproteobacteria bacterium]